MHSIKNISERNKIDTQSRANTYIRWKRLICKSDYNLKSGCTLKYSWNWKKPSRLGKKNPKKNQTPLGWVFSNPDIHIPRNIWSFFYFISIFRHNLLHENYRHYLHLKKKTTEPTVNNFFFSRNREIRVLIPICT